jgi:4-hydroxy-tetrahydrodipicolinate reductase
MELVAGISRSKAGEKASGALGLQGSDVVLAENLDSFLEAGVEVAVDFTSAEFAPEHVGWSIDQRVHIVVGTTGFDVDDAWREAPVGVFVAPNFAIGAVLMMKFAVEAAAHMPECEIIELHHDGKLDAPSGTAKRTAELIEAAGGNVHSPIHSVRLPGLVAHQEVLFGGAGQTLTIRHDSVDRESFMPGVLLAIRRVGSLDSSPVIGLEQLL